MAEYIEREAVCYQLAKQATIDGQPRAIKRAAKIVADFPAADVVPVRHGRWIETTQPLGWRDETCAECSVCGEDFVLDEWGMEDMQNLMLYCPNCGAKMDKDDDGDV